MVLWQLETVQIVMGNTSVVLSIGMGPMPAIVDLWGYDVFMLFFSFDTHNSKK